MEEILEREVGRRRGEWWIISLRNQAREKTTQALVKPIKDGDFILRHIGRHRCGIP